jgi:prefoldin subunit 5
MVELRVLETSIEQYKTKLGQYEREQAEMRQELARARESGATQTFIIHKVGRRCVELKRALATWEAEVARLTAQNQALADELKAQGSMTLK